MRDGSVKDGMASGGPRSASSLRSVRATVSVILCSFDQSEESLIDTKYGAIPHWPSLATSAT